MNDLFVAIRCCKTINTSNCWKEKRSLQERPGSEARGAGSLSTGETRRQGDQLNWNRTVSSTQSEGPRGSAVWAELVDGER